MRGCSYCGLPGHGRARCPDRLEAAWDHIDIEPEEDEDHD